MINLQTIEIKKDIKIKGAVIKQEELDLVCDILNKKVSKDNVKENILLYLDAINSYDENNSYKLISTAYGDEVIDKDNKVIIPRGYFKVEDDGDSFNLLKQDDPKELFFTAKNNFFCEFLVGISYGKDSFYKSFSSSVESEKYYEQMLSFLNKKLNYLKEDFEQEMRSTYTDMNLGYVGNYYQKKY